MKKYIIPSLIIILIIASIIAGVWLLTKDSPYPNEELAFLGKQGLLDEKGLPVKSPALIEQDINAEDENFEVLATKISEDNYQLAFKLENKSQEKKEFYLIPVSKQEEAEFQEINGVVNQKNILHIDNQDVKKQPLADLYDITEHRKQLRPELSQAYIDIQVGKHKANPIKITLAPNSTLLAKSSWKIVHSDRTSPLKSIYLLVHGSAGGAKDELTIIDVHSHPQRGEQWKVSFVTKGQADLIITPTDQSTINDLDFVNLLCEKEKKVPQILENDVIFYPNWKCSGTSQIIHYVKIAGKHTLKFQFLDKTAYAYNQTETTYEFLIRVEDNLTSREGDCVTFKPAGWDWGKIERQHYAILIVKDITFEQAQDWCSFEQEELSFYNNDGYEKKYNPKKYNFDLKNISEDKKNDWKDQDKKLSPTLFNKNNIKLKKDKDK